MIALTKYWNKRIYIYIYIYDDFNMAVSYDDHENSPELEASLI